MVLAILFYGGNVNISINRITLPEFSSVTLHILHTTDDTLSSPMDKTIASVVNSSRIISYRRRMQATDSSRWSDRAYMTSVAAAVQLLYVSMSS